MTDLYSVITKSIDKEEKSVVAEIRLNNDHNIFKGHFPSQPVLPGVCQVDIVAEILSKEIQEELKLIAANNIKYLKMVDPKIDEILNVTIKYSNEEQFLKVNAIMKSKDEICMKAKLKYAIL